MSDAPAEVAARLRTLPQLSAVAVDDVPPGTAGAYAVIYDSGGPATGFSYAPRTRDVAATLRVLVAARTPETVRGLRRLVRGRLNEWQPPSAASRLVERDAGPVLPSGVEGDGRWSATLVYRYTDHV